MKVKANIYLFCVVTGIENNQMYFIIYNIMNYKMS